MSDRAPDQPNPTSDLAASFKRDAAAPPWVYAVRQRTNYNCGPAVFTTVARLMGNHLDEADIAAACEAMPKVGTDNPTMESWARDNLPVRSSGSDSYEGGLAIANIRRKQTGGGHFVLFLGERDGMVRYFCPLYGTVETEPKDQIDWSDMSGAYPRWTINLDSDADYWDTQMEMPRMTFVVSSRADQREGLAMAVAVGGSETVLRGVEACVETPDGATVDRLPVMPGDAVYIDPRDRADIPADILDNYEEQGAYVLDAPDPDDLSGGWKQPLPMPDRARKQAPARPGFDPRQKPPGLKV